MIRCLQVTIERGTHENVGFTEIFFSFFWRRQSASVESVEQQEYGADADHPT